ncbi:MAG TPA: hypothetical protein VL752_12200 [Acidisoma sp.]|uniref:hypothetical protein n=1 Tax=Acidisoma sp. TaxID=1872115 RepID=UPI002CFE75D9|nr:hypothetical protein [Acidisoma sp.]HTI01699.1 hypothetical protein [Acidisoma sp.]
MPLARIDVAVKEKPVPGEKFTIALQENSEMLGLLDGGRTFRFKAPTATEEDYQQANRVLKVVGFDLDLHIEGEPRLLGSLTYSE